MRTLLKFVIVLMSCLFSQQAIAGHIASVEITYRWLDTLKYEVNFYCYRSCAGVSFSNPSSAANVVCQTSGSKVNMALKLVSIKELQTVCDTIGANCKGKNQTRSGGGTEVHLYRDTVDFRSTKYKGLINSGCTDIRFEIGLCCRNSSQTTGAANHNLFNYAVLSIKDGIKNSSPVFALPYIPNFICNQPVYYTVGSIDTLDGDSLSYAIVQPKSAINKTITTSIPPFSCYYSGTLKPPYNNPNANPPIGFYFDEKIGQLIFTPVKCSEYTTMVFEVREWRKDSSGKYQNIGLVRRDMSYSVVVGKGNNPPVLTSVRNYSVCEGSSLCVNFTAQDKVKVPPPPQPKPDPDTTKMFWNRVIPGGSFSIVNDSALNQTGKFCWTPEDGTARSLPYQFDIKIKDNNCPVNAISYYAIQIRVKSRAKSVVMIDSLGCGQFTVKSKIDSSSTLIPQYTWLVSDVTGKPLPDKIVPEFNSSHSFISKTNSDTIQFKTAGTYVIQHTINNRDKCPTTYYDTITVPDVMETNFVNGVDTFVCQGTPKTLSASVLNGSAPYTYVWSTGDTTQNGVVNLPDSVLIDEVSVTVKDKRGCTAHSKATILQRPRPVVGAMIKSYAACDVDSVIIEPQTFFAFWNDPRDTSSATVQQGSSLTMALYESNVYQETASRFVVKQSGDYTVIVTDSLQCSDSSHTSIRFFAKPNITTQDVTICQPTGELSVGETGMILHQSDLSKADIFLNCVDCGTYNPNDLIENKGDLTNPNYVLHLDRSNMPLRGKSKDSIWLSVEYRDSNGCSVLDTAMIVIKNVPLVTHQGFSDLCWNEGLVDLKQFSRVSPTDGIWRAIDSSGFAPASDINGAISGDTLSGDTLNTFLTPRPAEGSFRKYLMRYYHDKSSCVTISDTTLTIRGLPEPKIDLKAMATPFDSTAPFEYCNTESVKSLSANYRGGTWSCSNPAALSGIEFDPFSATVFGVPIEITYAFTDIYGCKNTDSVEVTINKAEKLEVRPDTSLTWYSDTMQIWVDAKPSLGRTVLWEALDGGVFANSTTNPTVFRFTTDKEISSNVRVKATLNEGRGGCPAPENTINIFVHRTPCIDFTMDLDLSTKLLKLTPDIDSLASYQWTVKDSNSFDVNAVIDVSAYTDSLVNVRLQTHNKGGDNCYTDKVINLKNGSISPIDFQEIVLYPNPVLNGFTIQMKDERSIDNLKLYNSVGSEVLNYEVDENYVDCSKLSSGIYSVVITVGDEVYVTKFVKSEAN